MDNCSIHHAKIIKKKIIKELDWVVIYNEAYKANYQPIEKWFHLVKTLYRKLILEDRKLGIGFEDAE